ncbi:MAG TPA: NAD(P)H-binding protein [Acidimicrobiales bacterium]|nr:NAD(P)H-binding protein [Acidimicrobiales bacterium]
MKVAIAGGTGVVGRFAVEAARERGHEVVVLSRSTGVDLRSGDGLAEALDGVEVVVDATNAATMKEAEAAAMFTGMTGNLQAVGAAQGVARLVTLSIVGLERVPLGYYRAKLAQEAAARAGPLPVTVVRATQFHEFPAQVVQRSRVGPVALVPHMRLQPVAARAVGQVLAEVAEQPAGGGTVEVAGPEVLDLVTMARTLARHRHRRLLVLPVPVPGAGKAMRTGGQLPQGGGARIVGPTFGEWLATDDAAYPPF